MKLLVGLFVSLAISSTFALPAGGPDDDAEYITTNRKHFFGQNEYEEPDFRDFKGVITAGPEQGVSRYPFFSSLPTSFNLNFGFFNAFEDIFRRLRTQLYAAEESDESSSSGSSESGILPFAINSKNGNTTSVVKVVNGHKVEINDTVYGDDNGRSIFKVRLINIRPLDGKDDETDDVVDSSTEIGTGTTTEDKGSPEIMEKSNNNEIDGDIDEPESTSTITSTTEMHDTPTERIPEIFGTNAIFDVNFDAAPHTVDRIDPVDSTKVIEEPTTEGFGNIENGETQSADMLKNEEELSIEFGKPQVQSEKRTDESMSDIENVTEKSIIMEENSDEIFLLENHNENAPSLASLSLPLLKIDNDDATKMKMTITPSSTMMMISSLTDYIPENLKNVKKNKIQTQSTPPSQPSQPSQPLREELLFSEEDEDEKNNNNENFESNEWIESMESAVDNDNNLDNDIDAYEGISVDLSNDIAINDLLNDQGVPFEPEAELFTIDDNSSNMEGRFGGKYQTSVNTQLSYNEPIKK